MRSHTQLDAWRRSIDFVVEIYGVTDRFPKEEKFGLTSQLRRASVSISANIAEGAARSSAKEYLQFLSHAQGSASELETELHIAHRLGFLQDAEYDELCKTLNDIGRMIAGIASYLKRTI